ncbi:unnamed protein product [Lactuca virosa]|uniref:Uncharacterized protein n=1 Tax=Lactuca virosa TaxID=75947 RepID=A0AAU9NF09_9ASTR|nr:unnamed protein product [Lactuca virosa]
MSPSSRDNPCVKSSSWMHSLTQTRFKKCNFIEWKDDEHEEGYYKNLLYSLKRKLDAKEDLSEMHNLRTRIVGVEFLLS